MLAPTFNPYVTMPMPRLRPQTASPFGSVQSAAPGQPMTLQDALVAGSAAPRPQVTVGPQEVPDDTLAQALIQGSQRGQSTPFEAIGNLAQFWSGTRAEKKFKEQQRAEEEAAKAQELATYQTVADKLSGDSPYSGLAQALIASGNPDLAKQGIGLLIPKPRDPQAVMSLAPGSVAYDPNTREPLFTAPERQADSYGFTTVNGQVVRTNKATGEVEPAYTAPGEPMARPATPEEKAAYGVSPETPLVIEANGKPSILPVEKKPTNDIQEYEYYANQEAAAGRQPLSYNDWSLQSKKAGATSITIGDGSDVFAGMPKDVRDEMFKRQGEAQDAVELVNIINNGRQILDQGAITGAGAGWKVGALKWANTLGIDVPQDAANNSETFKAIMGEAVGKIIKQFGSGTGLSDADREYAERIVGGSIELNEAAIRRIFEIGEKAARGRIANYTDMRDRVLSGDLGAMLNVPTPTTYTTAPVAVPPPASSQLQPGQKTNVGGVTIERVE